MKKENVVRKILIKGLIGFPVGVTLLVLAYISAYFIAGQEVFNYELYQLHNIRTLILQTLSGGISGYLLFIIFYNFWSHQELEKRHIPEHLYKKVFKIILSSMVLFLLQTSILVNPKIFSENIINLNIIVLLIFLVLAVFIYSIKTMREQHWINKINKILKKNNNSLK